jgi:hypothetical protein
MSMEHRIDRLERIHRPEEESFTFTIAKPPGGLTEAEQEASSPRYGIDRRQRPSPGA